MEINQSIFKSYDIRGIYPSELNEETARLIGQLFVDYTGVKNVVVGRDMRLSSPAIFKGLVGGIIERGADVYNLGEVPTELIYFSVGKYGYDSAIMITASHNPKEYNGFKMIKKEADKIDVVRGKNLLEILGKNGFKEVILKGKVEEIDIWDDYLNYIFSFIDIKKIKPFKVVIDAGNGMAGKVISMLAPKLPLQIIPLNFELDGNFPGHPSNPLLEGSASQIIAKILEEKADLGFIFDGDADRIFLLDEKGDFKKGDVALLLLAKYFLAKNPGAGIAYNLICSKAVPEFVLKWGGRPIKTLVGAVNVREGLFKNNGVVSGEISGHFSFKDNFYFDSGFIAFLTLLQILSEGNKKVSEVTQELYPYAKDSEINFEVKDKDVVLNAVKEKFSDGKQDYSDGVTVEYDDWWFNLRASNTEPLLRLTIEAKNRGLLEQKKKEIISLIENNKN